MNNINQIKTNKRRLSLGLLFLGIIFFSLNLRAPITAVGPLVALIKAEYNLSSFLVGLITTLPLISFAVFSPFIAGISNRFGSGLTMFTGLLLILIGVIIRSYTNCFGLYVGTTLLGLGIAIGNVLIPSIIKQKFPNKIGPVISLYTTGMCISAAIGAGISAPLTVKYNFSWQNSLAVWFFLALITIIIWLPQLNKSTKIKQRPEQSLGKSIWLSSVAWNVTLYTGVQACLFYSYVAWLPAIIISKGMSSSFAGVMALLFQLISIPLVLVVPIFAAKMKSQAILTAINSFFYFFGIVLLLFVKSKLALIIAVAISGIGMGGTISLAMLFLSVRVPTAKRAAQLSGMAQSAGYVLAALGPLVLGLLNDKTQGWQLPLMLLSGLGFILIILGYKAGQDKVT